MPNLQPGVNTWITLVEADAYFEEIYNREAWAALAQAEREKLLITSYRWIGREPTLSVPASSTADIVKEAQAELSWYILNYGSDHEKREALQDQGVDRFEVSKFREEFNTRKADFPEYIRDMLDDFTMQLGGSFPYIEREIHNG